MTKEIECHLCREGKVSVEDDYKEKFCCSGSFMSGCGCRGFPINPVFCDDCEVKLDKDREEG